MIPETNETVIYHPSGDMYYLLLVKGRQMARRVASYSTPGILGMFPVEPVFTIIDKQHCQNPSLG